MNRRTLRVRLTAAAAILLVSLAGACSDSDSGADDTSGGSAKPPGAADAKAAYDKYASPSTSINISTPLDGAPESGKDVYLIGNKTEDGLRVVAGMKEAAEAADWNLTVLSYDVDNLANGAGLIQQAVQAKPDFIAYLTLPESVVAPAVAEAKAAGIPVFAAAAPDAPSEEAWRFSNPLAVPDFILGAQIDANYIVSHPTATATSKILLVNVPSLSALKTFGETFESEVAANCPKCEVKELGVEYGDVTGGAVPAKVVAFLRANPEYKFVNFAVGAFSTGFSSAAKAAGLSLGDGEDDIKVSTYSPSPGNLTDIKNGVEQMGVGLGLRVTGWMVIDAMMRYDQGMSLEPNWEAVTPVFLFTPDNIGSGTELFDGPEGYPETFAELWHLSS